MKVELSVWRNTASADYLSHLAETGTTGAFECEGHDHFWMYDPCVTVREVVNGDPDQLHFVLEHSDGAQRMDLTVSAQSHKFTVDE